MLRTRLESGVDRVRVSWWAIGQSALGGAIAWTVAERLLRHQAPFFASVAAIIGLSVSVHGRLRRVVEMALGVAIGVGLGDLLVQQIGHGGWQMGAVVLIAMSIALLLDGGGMIVNQAALQAVFVVALPPPAGGYLGRWLDALIGGATALTIAFLLPADPLRGMREEVSDVVDAVARALRASAEAGRRRDPEGVYAALELGRATQPALHAWDEAVRAAEEISRLSPLRRRAAPEIATHRRSVELLDRAARNVRVALRRMVAAVEAGLTDPDAGPSPALMDRLDDLAGAFYTLPGLLVDPEGEGGRRARAALSALARLLDPQDLAGTSLSSTVVVAQLRSTVVDLLELSGLDRDDARAQLVTGTGTPPPPAPRPAAPDRSEPPRR
jgi:uncharacterized membrane protein YgaE (UPF0421/DUF939 family)